MTGGVDDDRGMATVWAAGAIAVLVSMAVFGLHLGEAMVVRHQVESAADLAALAGAATIVAGDQYACTQARRVTDRMRVQLASCRIRDWTVEVEATARPTGWLAALGTPTAQARAGPVGGASRRELDSTDVLLDLSVRAVEFTPSSYLGAAAVTRTGRC